MDVSQLLTGSKWEILEHLAQRPQSTSQIADKLGTSQANISQQMRQLELAGIVERRRASGQRVHYVYEIPKHLTFLTHVAPRAAQKKLVKLNATNQFLTALLIHKHAIPLMTFVLGKPRLFDRFLAVGIHNREHPEIFVVAERVDDLRRNANVMVKTIEGEHKVAIWSHTIDEIEQGIEHKDKYFLDSLKDISIVYDPDNTLLELRRELEATK